MEDVEDKEAITQEFMSITNASREIAISLLSKLQWDLQSAVMSFLENPPLEPLKDTDYVRPPIEPVRMKLIDDEPTPTRRGNPHRQPNNIFTTFRDLRREQELRHGDNSSKREMLADLFRPPYDILFNGTYWEALKEASKFNRFLLVNIQSEKQFDSHKLNRDTWFEPSIKDIIKSNFIFWQAQSDSSLAEDYIKHHHVSDLPHIGILLPSSDKLVHQWEGFVPPEDMKRDIQSFLRSNPIDIDNDFQESKRLRDVDDLTEEEQMKAAIEASLSETLEHTYLDEAANRKKRNIESNTNLESNKRGKFEDVVNEEEFLEEEEEEADDISIESEEPIESVINEGDKCTIMINLPQGTKVKRDFNKHDKLIVLFNFVKRTLSTSNFDILTSFPKKVFTKEEIRTLSFVDADLTPRSVLFVELLD